MGNLRRTRWHHGQLTVRTPAGDAPVPLLAASFAFAQTAPSSWAARLGALAEMGVRIVELTPVWAMHEAVAGPPRFDGVLDIAACVRTAAEVGLAVAVQLGPTVGSHTPRWGLPAHVVDDLACQARTAAGTPAFVPWGPVAFPAPSSTSAAFRTRVATWYAALGAQLADLCAPDGPIVAIGLGRAPTRFGRDGDLDLDYHPDVVTRWHAHHNQPPPRPGHASPDDLRAWHALMRELDDEAVQTCARAAEHAGFAGLAAYHDDVGDPVERKPGHASTVARPVLLDHARGETLTPMRALGLAASRGAPAIARLAVARSPYLPPVEAHADRFRLRDAALSALAAGASGLWLDGLEAPVGMVPSSRGRHDEAWFTQLGQIVEHLNWPTLRRRIDAVIVVPSPDPAPSLLPGLPALAARFLGLEDASAPAGLPALADTARRAGLVIAWVDAVDEAGSAPVLTLTEAQRGPIRAPDAWHARGGLATSFVDANGTTRAIIVENPHDTDVDVELHGPPGARVTLPLDQGRSLTVPATLRLGPQAVRLLLPS